MGSENEAEQSFERPCRFAAVGPSRHTISPHPSSREGHHPPCGGARVLLIGFDVALLCCRSLLPGPAELGAINPDAVHDDGQAPRQRDNRLFQAAAPGDLHRPGLEPGPSC